MPARVDVLVIGSGPVGSAPAVGVIRSQPDAKVLIIEVGPLLTDDVGINVKNIADLDERAAAQMKSQGPTAYSYGVSSLQDRTRRVSGVANQSNTDRLARPGTFLLDDDVSTRAVRSDHVVQMKAAALSSNVGGMGVHWTCACPWPYGSERVPFIDDQELDADLAEARRLLAVTEAAYPRNTVGDAVLAALGQEYRTAPVTRTPRPMPLAVAVRGDEREWTGPATIFAAADTDVGGISLRPETLAKQLVWHDDIVTGAVLVDRATGQSWTIDATTVVVAADSFRTPQLLWASGIRPTALGRYLNDHTQIMSVAVVDLHGEEPPASALGDDPLIGVYWIPFSEAHPFHAQVMQFDLSPIALDSEVDSSDNTPTVGIGLLAWIHRWGGVPGRVVTARMPLALRQSNLSRV